MPLDFDLAREHETRCVFWRPTTLTAQGMALEEAEQTSAGTRSEYVNGCIDSPADQAQADKQFENYLGHSIMAPMGRWQNNFDVHFYNREKTDEEQGQKRKEIRRIKRAEEDALSAALGFAPSARPLSDSEDEQQANGAKAIDDGSKEARRAERAERRARKEARRQAREEKDSRRRDRHRDDDRERRDYRDSDRRRDDRDRDRPRSRSPLRREDDRERPSRREARRDRTPSPRRRENDRGAARSRSPPRRRRDSPPPKAEAPRGPLMNPERAAMLGRRN